MLSHQILAPTWKNIKKSYKNKFKISASIWKDKLKLIDGLHSVPNISDYFQQIIKKHETETDNTAVKRYANKIEN